MSGSGLIYAAIAILWAAVLIPMWLRNHDTATENRSAERFGQAMRVLSRGGQRDEQAGEEHEGYETHEEYHESHDRADAPAAEPARTPVKPQTTIARPQRETRPRREARAPLTLAQRRARSLGVLAGLTLFMVVLSLITPLPLWLAAPFVVLLGAFVVHLRVQARQKLQRRRPALTPQPHSTRASASEEAREVGEAVDSGAATTVVQGPSRAVVVERKGAGRPAAETAEGDEEAWQPNPLPLPTYVTAPKAVRPIKVIDLTTPGAWTSGRLLDDDLAAEDLLAAQVAEDELDALLEQEVVTSGEDSDEQKRRAVGD